MKTKSFLFQCDMQPGNGAVIIARSMLLPVDARIERRRAMCRRRNHIIDGPQPSTAGAGMRVRGDGTTC
jgi:hypothetical protein